ncbi:S8 family serine peptidase [Natrialbaceae archaeon A-gly3]
MALADDVSETGIDEVDDVVVDPDLADEFEAAQDEGETVEVVVQLEDASVSDVPQEDVEDVLEEHAEETQQPLLEVAETTDGITIVSEFWVTNAVLLEIDAEAVELDVLESVDEVEELHGNIEVPVPEPPLPPEEEEEAEPETVSGYETTYGLAQIGVPAVWDEHRTKGSGVTVAVLDTGIDASHPDLELYTDDPDDPSYPGGWAEFDERGERVEGSTPHDSAIHGTHVSGTIAGGDASGVHVGVAPDVDLVHGKVLDEEGGTYGQILAGMEWAVESDADVLSMSFGATGTYDRFITPVRNVEESGVVPIVAVGNEGHKSSDSPGNVYDAVAIGATDAEEAVASFSGGETLTRDDWSEPPADWPEEYVVPDLVAPGVSVYSTVPGGHDYASGTSMATPHVAGTVALMLSVDAELRPDDVVTTLDETAHKPANAPAKKDDRYGLGIVDAEAAVDAAKSVSATSGDGDTRTNESDPTEADDAEVSPEPAGEDGTPGFGVAVALVSIPVALFLRHR